MSELEFIMVAVSILLALSLTRLLDSAYVNICGRGDWLLSAWLVNRLAALILVFWSFRTLLEYERVISFYEFLIIFASPVLIFFQSLVLTPDADVRSNAFESSASRRPLAVLASLNALTNAYVANLFGVPESALIGDKRFKPRFRHHR